MTTNEAKLKWDNLAFREQYDYIVLEIEDHKRYGIEQANFLYSKGLERINRRLNKENNKERKLNI